MSFGSPILVAMRTMPIGARFERAPPRRSDERRQTRAQLLEAAGRVFAEKGFDRATGKEICARARANAAAINYYFGGMDGLYAAVLEAAHSRFFTLDMLAAAVQGLPDAKAKLEALLNLVVGALAGPVSRSWELRVLGRELVAPSSAFAVLRDEEFLPKLKILKAIVGELMRLPPEHPAVGRGCIAIMGPCIMLAVADPGLLKRAFPRSALGPGDAPGMAHHLARYALAGIAALAGEEKARAPR